MNNLFEWFVYFVVDIVGGHENRVRERGAQAVMNWGCPLQPYDHGSFAIIHIGVFKAEFVIESNGNEVGHSYSQPY